ncbi:hypothetical protein B0T16DRAFT_407934 [Cercophora newfieldiana]|uniref:Protein NO VEIN C-terminal domain-containing protein n=1 Tax=Cercophora newfieldiana TaxID=92897 RepID=A0AA39YB42_9PEZI|nr:hypothetical protein B0T16DRAFT_407934 [Cercophora newfieldiana]
MEFPPAPAAVAAAQELVRSIAFDHGYLGEEVYSNIHDPETSRQVREALGKKDQLIGSSVMALAQELYSKDVRFIFELLQSADDNPFKRATESGHQPYVVFRVYHDRIVVDCNEDGFDEATLRAICDVGRSSKVGRQGYIGEKGIGFKSVFKVAWKVHVQSRAYSFSFTHRPGDSGMGMISPAWHAAEALPEPMTRMTLLLHDGGDPDIQAAQRKDITDEFEQLQPSMMLFLKNIKRIEIRFFDTASRETKSSVMTRVACDVPNRDILETVRTSCGNDGRKEASSSRLNYHVTRGTASGLARNENRQYSPEEKAARVYSAADIVLAFPLDDNSVPIDEPQNIFAFLPMRHVGFNFMIHSDFVTTENRENIVTSSLRNQGLRQHIANTFVLAVEQMCLHPQLRFQWMRFLPRSSGHHINDSFWNGFVDVLKQQLANAKIMVPRIEQGPGRTLKQVKQFPRAPPFIDQDGDPVFDDLGGDAALYVSQRYQKSDLRLLRSYGLKMLSMKDIAARVQADLERGSSKMRSPTTDSSWHSLAAAILKAPFTSNVASSTAAIRSMRLLPLDDGQWVSARVRGEVQPVYFPTTSSGTKIPPALDIRLICPDAAAHPDRKDLFLTLGAKMATDDEIRSLVLRYYIEDWVSLPTSIAWLRFLYLTRPEKGEANADSAKISIKSSSSNNLHPSMNDVYLPDDTSDYGAAKLGLAVDFLHPDYLKDPPVRPGEQASGAEALWRRWLHNTVGIRERLRLVTPDGAALSGHVLHVAQHIPERFLGLLHHLWPHEGSKVWNNDALKSELEGVNVLCDGGEKHPLHATMVPTAHLKALSSRFLREGELLPFLKLENTTWNERARGWVFVEALGALNDDGLAFHLEMLQCIVATTPRARDLKEPTRILDLYKAIHGKCIVSDDLEEAREIVRSAFHGMGGIYVPSRQEDGVGFWADPADCLLNADLDLEHKAPVDTAYNSTFGKAVADLETVHSFLRDTLGIPRLTWTDYMAELRYLADEKCSDFDLIEAQYKRLNAAGPGADDLEQLRKSFRDECLIFVAGDDDDDGKGGRWYSTKECLWSPGSGVQGLVNLAKIYDPNLEPFFVEALQVTRLTAQLLFDELLTLSDEEPAVDHVKQQLLTFSSLLREAEPGDLSAAAAPQRLLEKPILPIKHTGDVSLLPATTGFTIIDRAGPMKGFRVMVKTLDFSMQEVHELEPFIRWAGLQDRYLSRMVREIPDLGSGKKFRVSDPRYELKKKAHGLVRVAKYFQSPRFSGNGQALYDLLRGSETWETDDISATLTLTLDGETHSTFQRRGEVYMSGEDTSPLKIFIPHNGIAQDVCVQGALPRTLVEWLMASPRGTSRAPAIDDKAVGIVKGLLNAHLQSIPRILTQEGIHEIEIANTDDLQPDEHTETLVDPTRTAPRTPLRSRPPSPGTPGLVFTPAPAVSVETPVTDPFSSPSPSFFPLVGPPPPDPLLRLSPKPGHTLLQEPQEQSGPELYRPLLNRMIQAGKQVPFPDQGVFDMSGLAGALDGVFGGSGTSAIFSGSNFSTVQLGAAGELFVFEMLQSLGSSLPGFSTPNWTSNIKAQVKIHPDYETMPSWGGGAEISDLQYSDTSGAFTALLIEKGHLSSEKWAGKRPTYYFEVKSTPRACNEPFYMSGLQYKKVSFFFLFHDSGSAASWHLVDSVALDDRAVQGRGQECLYHLSGV